MAPGLGGSGSFRRGRRLDTTPRQRSKPLEMGEAEKKWLAMTPPGAGTRLGRAGYGPKPPSLPAGYVYAKAAAIGDVISCEGDEHEVIGKVLAHRPRDGAVLCRNLGTGGHFVVAGDTIVELGFGS